MATLPLDPTDLEAIVDEYGIEQVTSALSDICAAKAEHIRTNWHDRTTARPWDSIASRLALVAAYARGRI